MKPQFLDHQGRRLAYLSSPATRPNLPHLMFLGGFRSDMTGTKATWLEAYARTTGHGYTRFDYSGHGQSEGVFEDCTLEQWRDDALMVFDRLTEGPTILIGSSMGGWLGLLLGLARPERVCGLIGIAAAPDFTRTMVTTRFTDEMRAAFEETGCALVPNDYGEPYLITRALIESGNRLCLLDRENHLDCPVHLIQGLQDRDVDGATPEKIQEAFPNTNMTLLFIGDGDHSLSRPQDLEIIKQSIEAITQGHDGRK